MRKKVFLDAGCTVSSSSSSEVDVHAMLSTLGQWVNENEDAITTVFGLLSQVT